MSRKATFLLADERRREILKILKRDDHLTVVGRKPSECRELGAHHLFLGIDGLTLELELATPDVLEEQLNTVTMQVAEETTVILDGSEFGRRGLSRIAVLTYIGFGGVSTLGEEVKNPQRNILSGTVLVCLITGVLPVLSSRLWV